MTISLHGLGVARGIAIGYAMVLHTTPVRVTERIIAAEDVDAEVLRYRQALADIQQQWHELRNDLQMRNGTDLVALLDVHILMLADKSLASAPVELIKTRRCNAEWALKIQRDQLIADFSAIDDAYLRSRQADIDQVIMTILRTLNREYEQRIENVPFGAIVVAEELSPAEMLSLHKRGVVGFVTEMGGPNSHSAIITRSLELPALVSVDGARNLILDGELLILDGWNGALWIGADERILSYFRQRKQQGERDLLALQNFIGRPAMTYDQVKVRLHANVELLEDLPHVARVAADGVGLFRTEMLFLSRDAAPDEEDQLEIYRQVLAATRGGAVTIRTLDIGCDKIPPWFDLSRIAGGPNPALGLRGLRWCLTEPGIFRTQLRALLRLAHEGDVRMMLPMVTTVAEVLQVRAWVAECATELRHEGLAHRADIPIGAMVEVPAAAIAADQLARHVDFMSIGTNDLIQYTLAADRVDDEVRYLYDPLHPAVLCLIRMTIEAGARAGIPVAMCGEMAGEVRYTRLLLGLGLREFSMHPAFLLEIKKAINSSDTEQLKKWTDTILAVSDPSAYGALVDVLNIT